MIKMREWGRWLRPRLPGYAGTLVMGLLTMFWTFWGVAEMFHEGWWGAWYNRLLYLVPPALFVTLSVVSIAWPLVGGGLIVLCGVFFIFMFELGDWFVAGVTILLGLLLVVDGVRRRRGALSAESGWWRRARYLFVMAPSVLIALGILIYWLPTVLGRADDGIRSARLIEGNGVALIWAPAGPGWNWKQPWGGYPSWQSLALYGVQPMGLGAKPDYGRTETSYTFAVQAQMEQTGLCRYLAKDGFVLMDEPQDVWRMPTVDELVRSLGRHGQNAGCAWRGEFRVPAICVVQPDKESPLWATDQAPIYYWAAEEWDERRAYFVCYNGTVNATMKSGGNPRHGYRCVRDP